MLVLSDGGEQEKQRAKLKQNKTEESKRKKTKKESKKKKRGEQEKRKKKGKQEKTNNGKKRVGLFGGYIGLFHRNVDCFCGNIFAQM